jgi:protease-4
MALWIFVGLLALALVASVVLNAGLFAGLMAASGARLSVTDYAVDEYPDVTEVWSYGDGDVKAARIPVTGIIAREAEGGLFETPQDKIELILAQIRAASNDEDVQAILLEVDSPGGGITPSDEIYQALLDFKAAAEGRKVVVFARDLAASGGYYVAMAGDWIMAEPTSIIGSIGVLIQTLNWKGLSERIGITDVTIKSGANKDLLNPFIDVPEEQRQLLQSMVDSMYNRFLSIVQGSRPIEPDTLRGLADGRIFDAAEALGHKLIDEIGYWDDAIAKTAELLNVEQVKVVRYEQQPAFLEWLSGVKSPLPSTPSALDALSRPRFLYLWSP